MAEPPVVPDLDVVAAEEFAAQKEQIHKLWASFQAFDENGNGVIESHELEEVMLHLGKSPSKEELQMLMLRADGNGDGTVDFAEFCALMGVAVKPVDDDEANLAEVFTIYE